MPIKGLVVTALAAGTLSVLFTAALLPALKRLKVAQPINEYVTEHNAKSGTPTMGGIGFVLSAFMVGVIGTRFLMTSVVTGLVFLLYAALGFVDDFLKIRYAKNEGLTPKQKVFFQVVIALLAAFFCLRTERTFVYIPFSGGKTLEMGWLYVPFAAFVLLATTNCVNLTDGLDGLASSCAIPAFGFLGAVGYLRGGECELIFSIAIAAALVGFLPFNVYPARSFMGDTGSLALGGLLACLALFSGNALYVPLVGFCFVWSGLSVIIQVLHYKRTKKRVFLMAPFHHHLQHEGKSEPLISAIYFAVSVLFGLLALLGV